MRTASRHPSNTTRVAARAALLAPLLAASVGGCAPVTAVPVVGGLGADIAIFHRSLFDMVWSAMAGRDCSVVHLDRGERYCTHDVPVASPPYCTRSLGTVDCWADPAHMRNLPPQVAQGGIPASPAPAAPRL